MPPEDSMKQKLQAASIILAVIIVGFWFFGGMHRGWTRTNETIMKVDPVTSLDYPVTEKKFTPGVDFLAIGLGASGFLFGLSYLFRRNPKQHS